MSLSLASVFVALLLVAIPISAQDCKISLQQQQRGSWTYNGAQHVLYDAFILNSGATAVSSSITLTTTSNLEEIWALSSTSGNSYTLPNWRDEAGGIPVGSFHYFGYVTQSDQPAEFEVDAPGCTVDQSTVPTSAPSTPTEAPTTEAPTEAPTEAASSPTTSPTSSPTRSPTSSPTSSPTRSPTSSPTRSPTSSPTSSPTRSPTSSPTSSPTRSPTTAPTSSPTSAPTSSTSKSPTTSPSTGTGRLCASGSWWAPGPQTTWQWQLTGTVDTSVNVQMYDIDLFDASASLISTLHSKGRAVICYFSTQYENWRPDASKFPSSALGNDLDDWAGEKYVDIRSSAIRTIMTERMDLAVTKGCDGIEPDNVDGYQASTGFPLKAADQLDYNKFLATEAHKRGLSIGLKNDVDQASALQPNFDWALNEQCNEYSECDTLSVFISAGKAVFNTEYTGSASSVCPKMVNLKISALIKSLDLGAAIKAQCCTYQSNGCAEVAYKCVSSS